MDNEMKGLEKFQPDTYYHIVNHAVGSENLFRTDENYHYFLRRYARICLRYAARFAIVSCRITFTF